MISKTLLMALLASILVSQVFGQQQNLTKYSFASIRRAGKHICGGTFISLKAILTAGQCFYNDKGDFVNGNYTVSLGVKNETDKGLEVLTAGVFVHNKFRVRSDLNESDIAVLKLKNDVSNAQVFSFPGHIGIELYLPTITGFGFNKILTFEEQDGSQTRTIAPDITLRTAFIQIVDNTFCKGNNICFKPPYDSDGTFGICTGGAGNGIVFNNQLVGVVSQVSCSLEGYYVHTNLTTQRQFITEALVSINGLIDAKYVPF